MDLTIKQKALRDYLLERIGFTNGDFLEQYKECLSGVAPIYSHLGTIHQSEVDETQENFYRPINRIGDDGDFYETSFSKPIYFGIVDLLMFEYNFKKNSGFKTLSNTSNYLSATDLANFIYCPIGFSISKTFEQIDNELAQIGTSNHEKKVLEKRQLFEYKNKLYSEEADKSLPIYINSQNKYFFDEVANSQIVYSGHNQDEDTKYFINDKKDFVGQPDYIFKNKQGLHYIVEEKFKVYQEDTKHYFADGHRTQLASYIHYLEEYDIKYGYLVYWVCRRDRYGYVSIDDCLILKINKEKKIEVFLDGLIGRIKQFTLNKSLSVDNSKLSPKKCASCVHMLACGHKTQRYKEVSIPYSKNYFKLYYSPYPDILKKKSEEEIHREQAIALSKISSEEVLNTLFQ